MERIRAVVVDDEPLARARLRALLEADPEIDLIAECVDGFEAVATIRASSPDLVFLDVQMPEKDGFEVITEIGVERSPAVVFVTAFDQYALRAFEAHALAYLLKPFDEKHFQETLRRVKTQIRNARSGEIRSRLLSLIEELKKSRPGYLERLLVKTGSRLFFVKTAELDWIKAEGNYVRLHVGNSAYLLRETVNHLESQLDPERFLRIHRSTIVNLERVKEIQQMFHGEYRVILTDGTELALSRNYREKLLRFTETKSPG